MGAKRDAGVILADYVHRATAAKAASDEIILRGLLSRWVSELDPVVMIHQDTHRILGLGMLDDPTGAVYVERC